MTEVISLSVSCLISLVYNNIILWKKQALEVDVPLTVYISCNYYTEPITRLHTLFRR